MAEVIHTTKVYNVQYGAALPPNVTDDLIELIRCSHSGYISDADYPDLEIDREELIDLRQKCKSRIRDAIDTILRESDPNNDFIHLSIF